MPDRSGPRTKSWCFTLNNPEGTSNCDKNIYCIGFNADMMSYLIQGIETGEKGTKHIQGFVIFHNRARFSVVKRLLPQAHWEACRGTDIQNRAYCLKDGEYCEHGEFEQLQGKRSDLESLHETLRANGNIREIIDKHFESFIKYSRGIERVLQFTTQRRNWEMEVLIYWGEAGSGKTRKAFEESPDAYFKDNTRWWTGYCSTEDVIWDEFTGASCSLSYFLKITDRYPMQVETKGGYAQFCSKKIVFTSNYDPREWYEFRSDESRRAFERRITRIVHFKRLVNSDP